MKMILAALDLESGSDTVLSRAAQLATAHAAWLVLLHIISTESLSDVVAVSGHSESDLQNQLRQQARATLDRFLIESGRTRRSEVRVEFGSPHEVITRVAGELSADLIVIGAHKGLSLREKVLGSTADRVIRTSPAPTLVVKSRSVAPYRQITVAIDFSPQSKMAAKEARRLAPEARLQLVHVVDIPLTFEQTLRHTGTSQAEIEEHRLARAARARDDLSVFAHEVSGPGEVVTRSLEGDPGPALVRLSRSSRVDLLALGPHGRGVVLQALLGSVTQRVLREAACDVLVASTRQ